jgi:Flp pilus assembly protein TadD
MRMKTWFVVALVLACATPIMADKRADAKAQVEFGVLVARRGLWKEALFRWKQATVLDPLYVAAWNDLAIAYEQLGQFSSAREAYETALKIAPNDATVNQNYEMFRDLYDRQNKRRDNK